MILGAVQTPLTSYIALKNVWDDTTPEISLGVDDIKSFAVPIKIRNKSSFFDLKDVRVGCSHEVHQNKKIRKYASIISTTTRDLVAKIPPGTTFVFKCFDDNNQINSETAILSPQLEYKTLWMKREYQDKSFIWYGIGKDPRWLESG